MSNINIKENMEIENKEGLLRKFNNFIGKVNKNGCIEWVGSINRYGYGYMYYRCKTYAAHRLAYMLEFGVIPSKKFVCHSCENRKCVTVEHLFLGNPKESINEMLNVRKNITISLPKNMVENVRKYAIKNDELFEDVIEAAIKEFTPYEKFIQEQE